MCFLLCLAGVGAALGSGRHIHPEWSAATFVFFGLGLSLAYAAFLSFIGVGWGLFVACNKSGLVKLLLASIGIAPLTLSVAMLLVLRYGGDDPVARLMSLLPLMQWILIVLLLGVVVPSCLGWRYFASTKRDQQGAGGKPPESAQPPHEPTQNTRLS